MIPIIVFRKELREIGFIHRLFNPMIFQGVRRKQNYFEGWYHKHVSPKGYAYAIIGGLAFAKDRKGHSFVQVIRGSDGSSMPSNWIWIQGNSFPSPKTCFMLSVATIPWMGSSFIGFLGVFHTRGKEYRFATYTGARIKNIHIAGEEVTIQLFNKKYNCKIRARRSSTGFLKAPVFGDMERRIAESIDATVEIQIEKRENNEVIFQERSPYAGLELVGDISKLSWQLTSDSKNQRVSSLL